jgi:hypothetical protein
MPAFRDLTGQTFNRLTVVRLNGRTGGRHAWLCSCVCGNETSVITDALKSGKTKSCGCLNDEVRSAMTAIRNRVNARKYAEMHVKHGHKRLNATSKTYAIWRAMKERCANPVGRNECYVGVSVCERWKEDFRNFLADLGEKPEGKSLDRINPFGNYEPENCRWATAHEQRMNTRSNWLKRNQVERGAWA